VGGIWVPQPVCIKDAYTSVNYPPNLDFSDLTFTTDYSHCENTAISLCGNGTLDPGETCDTALSYSAVACGSGACTGTQTRTCNACTGFTFGVCSSSGSVCTPAGQCTNAALCSSAGVCPAATIKPDTTSCNDSNACTNPDTCTSGVCSGPNICNVPDLGLENLGVLGILTEGNTLSFSSQVTNLGLASAGAVSQTRLRIDRDRNSTWDVFPSNESTSNLSAGATETETWTNAWTNVPAGNHRMEVCADVTGTVSESNESNNCATYDFVVSSGSCTTLTYQPSTSGFSTNQLDTAPFEPSLTVAPGSTFYAFVDYGAATDAVIGPNVAGAYECNVFEAFVGTIARFKCVAPSNGGSYVYTTGTNSGTASNICASGPTTVGTITVPAPAITLSPVTMNFSATSGGAAPVAQTFTVRNSGTAGSTLKWRVTTNQDWCFVNGVGNGTYINGADLASGATSPNLSVTMSPPSNVGSFSCIVTVSDNGSSPSATNSPQTVTATYTVTAAIVETCTGMSGYITRNFWSGISGSQVSNLTSNANYPNNPTSSSQPTSFEAPTNIADNYGTRMHGLLKAPATGSYRFYIASDDYSDLYLSTDSNPANKTRIAYVAGWTNSREWTKYASQTSAAINLTAGQTYYIEALHKEGAGGDNLAVGWQVPGSGITNIVPGSCLGPYVSIPTAPGGNPSPNPGGYNSNSSNPPGGGSVACEYIRLAWTDNSTNETGFKIYKDGVYLATAPASSPASATGGTLTYNFAPGDLNAHNYTVAATGSGGDSAQVSLQNNPISAIACVANLNTSDKDIVAINGVNIGTGLGNQCSGTDTLPVGTQLNLGNKVKFSINLCNSGTAPATGITVTDRMTNLIMPSGGWNAKYDSGTGEAPIASAGITLAVSGTAPNQILTFTNVPNVPAAGDPPPAIRRITFEAQLSIPVNFSATSARFQNSFTATYNAGTINKNTPLILFFTGQGIPIIIEVP